MTKEWVSVFDVDGTFSDGGFYYTKDGKIAKRFGPDDFDAIKELKKFSEIHIVTADRKGWPITAKRFIGDLGWKLDLVDQNKRWKWIRAMYPDKKIAYIGDSLYDFKCFRNADFAACPTNTLPHIVQFVDYQSGFLGGHRFVADVCLHMIQNIFGQDILKVLDE